MTLRRLSAAVPLAGLVAILAHVAGVGFEHAPGGSHAAALALGLTVTLLLALSGAFARGVLRPDVADTIATSTRGGYPPWALAATGFAVYTGIELLEGHWSLGGAARALAGVLPAACAVAFASRCCRTLAHRAGVRFAGFARSRGLRASGFARLRPGLGHRPWSSLFASSRRDRAPPSLV